MLDEREGVRMGFSIASDRKENARARTRTVTLFQLVVLFLAISFAFIFLGLFMDRMGWILVLGSIVLPHLPFTVAVLSALACLTLTIAGYTYEKRAERTTESPQKNNAASKREKAVRGCAGFLIGFVAAMIVFNGSLALWFVSDERIGVSGFDITEDRTVRVTSQIGWSAHSKTSVYDLAPYSIIACYSYTTTS